MTDGQDPFQTPKPIASVFASAQSFRGRVILIEPTNLELDVPGRDEPTKKADRLTATVTTLDGRGPVQVYSNREATGVTLAGPVHKGVWFSQDRIRDGVLGQGNRHITPGTRIIAVLDTYKPGKGAGPGNPWGLVAPTDAQRALAAQLYAQLQIGGAQAPAPQAAPAQEPAVAPQQAMPAFDPNAASPTDNPFSKGEPPF